ncbi:MAG: hypothetical protein HYU66_21145 [Armatimonadetes bacterium]|nr:hypothetical protein [Armatimonadota bacterium]
MIRVLCLCLCAAALAADADLPVVVDSVTHPSPQNDFDRLAEPWAGTPVEEEPPTVALTLEPEAGRGKVLVARNQVSGGFFGVTIFPRPRRNTPLFSRLAFDYRADPRLKANLIARLGHQDYEIGFTGPPCDTGQSIWLGRLEGVQADGQWHHLEVPLLRLLRLDQPLRRKLLLTELGFANQHYGDYLLAGFGGNQAGTALAADNFELLRPGPADAEFTWEVRSRDPVDGFCVVADTRPDTSPPEQITTAVPTLQLTGLADGDHWLHVRAHRKDGQWGSVTHHRFQVDTRPPVAGEPVPADGAAACPAVWRCRLRDAGVGVLPASITVTLGDRTLTPQDPAVRYDPLTETLSVDLAAAGFRFKDGQKVGLSLTATDDNDVPMPQPFECSFTVKAAEDHDPPENPVLKVRLAGEQEAEPLPGEGTFEYGLDEWKPFGAGGTLLERSTDTAAGGKYSLKLTCTEDASPFSCFVRQTPFDAARYRVLSFDYKAPARLRVDFLLRHGDQYCRVRFTDQDEDSSVIGAVPKVVQDDQWHHAEVNLFDLLRARFPRDTDFTVGMLLLTGGPWSDAPKRFPGNYAGEVWYVDNFHLVPMLGADTQLEWTADDAVGVAGAEVVSAGDPKDLPGPDAHDVGQKVAGRALPLEQLKQGLVYLWARLYDPAGNLSRPLSMRLLIDAGRPVIGAVWPAPDSHAAPPSIGVELRDDQGAGLDLSALALEVDGQTYKVDNQVLVYQADGGRLIWDGRRATPPIAFPDGKTVAVKLLEARDQAGNRPKELPAWQFVVDFKADKRGPDVEVNSPTHAAHYADGFESEFPSWHAVPAAAAAVDHADDGRGAGGKALTVTPKQAEGPYAVWHEFDRPYAASRFSLLAFDYRLPPGTPLQLLLSARNAATEFVPVSVTLTAPADGVPVLGAAQGIVADGQWHQALLPARDLLSTRADTFKVPYVVKAVGFGNLGKAAGKAGESWQIDRCFVFRPATTSLAQLEWQAFDETGVAGYSFVLDDKPDTVPPAQVATTDTSLSLSRVPAGLSWFHIRAVDGAGNWGPPATFILSTPAP